jgi:hypothetical protein
MHAFIARHAAKIIGVLSGFDRLVLRGTLRSLSYADGMFGFLCRNKVPLLGMGRYFERTTESLKQSSLRSAHELNRPIVYLESSNTDKEDTARQILKTNPVQSGLICVLSCVEPCRTFEYHRDRDRRKRGLKPRLRKCLFLYHYFLDERFGFMNARIQTWFPFSIQICLNGREWLARQMLKADIPFQKRDNCFPWIKDVPGAQRLMNKQLEISWPLALDRFARVLNPAHVEIFKAAPQHYYWSVYQHEWATDVMFKDSQALASIYPSLVQHAMTNFASDDVMRFLAGKVNYTYQGEIVSDFKDRPEGVRVKHRLGQNTQKMYDKAGSVLRDENTMNDPSPYKVYRRKEGEPNGKLDWRPLRKGIADIHRRAEISQAINGRYLDALAVVQETTPVRDLVRDICRSTTLNGKRVRALEPWSEPDAHLLEAVNRGEFIADGFRNRDIRTLLHPRPRQTKAELRRRSAQVSRKLRMLRAHGLIRRVPKTHRYQLTERGRLLIAAIVATRHASVSKLIAAAA